MFIDVFDISVINLLKFNLVYQSGVGLWHFIAVLNMKDEYIQYRTREVSTRNVKFTLNLGGRGKICNKDSKQKVSMSKCCIPFLFNSAKFKRK